MVNLYSELEALVLQPIQRNNKGRKTNTGIYTLQNLLGIATLKKVYVWVSAVYHIIKLLFLLQHSDISGNKDCLCVFLSPVVRYSVIKWMWDILAKLYKWVYSIDAWRHTKEFVGHLETRNNLENDSHPRLCLSK